MFQREPDEHLRQGEFRRLARQVLLDLAARDSVGEALQVYEQLRKVLRDELGASPGAATRALQQQLLKASGLQA